MKPSTKYISLLLIGGLMLFFYFNKTSDPGKIAPPCSYSAKSPSVKQGRSKENSFSFFKDVIANILPELKKLD